MWQPLVLLMHVIDTENLILNPSKTFPSLTCFSPRAIALRDERMYFMACQGE